MADVPTIRRAKHAAPQHSAAAYGAYNTPDETEVYGRGYGSGNSGYGGGYGGYDAYQADPYGAYEAPRKRRGCGCAIAFFAVLLALSAVAGVFGFRLYQSAKVVRADAKEMLAEVKTIKKAMKSGNAEQFSEAAQTSVRISDRMVAEVSTPMWDIAQNVPILGDDIKIVRTMATLSSDLSNNALVPLSESLAGVKISDIIADNRINADMFKQLSNALLEAMPAFRRALDTVDALPDAHLPQVEEAMGKVAEPLEEMRVFIEDAEQIISVIPAMLGAEGTPRTYLVIAQNNAESRSMGGLIGSWGILTVDNGAINMNDFSSILHWPDLMVATDEEEKRAFETNYDTDPAQVNFVADFTRVGEMCREFWLQAKEQSVDGVIAVDPVFFQWMMGLTGGITDYDEYSINGDNAAEVLMSKVYWWYSDNQTQDYFFTYVAGTAAHAIFDNLSGIDVDDLLDVLERAISQRRLFVWMAEPAEEDVIKLFGADGALSDDPERPVLGIYLNDSTWSKMSWYTALDTQVSDGVKNADGTTTYDVTATMTNTITQDEAWNAAQYVTGYNGDKRSVDDKLDTIFILAPAGGTITDLEISNLDSGPYEKTYRGHQIFRFHTALLAGESSVMTFKVTVAPEAQEPLAIHTTAIAQEGLRTHTGPDVTAEE